MVDTGIGLIAIGAGLAVGLTGLGAGITGYGNSYDILPDAAKWILSALMLIGRLEIFTVLVLLTPSFWRR